MLFTYIQLKRNKYTSENDLEAKEKKLNLNKVTLRKPSLRSVDLYKIGKGKKSDKHEIMNRNKFMEMVSKKLQQKKDITWPIMKTKNEKEGESWFSCWGSWRLNFRAIFYIA